MARSKKVSDAVHQDDASEVTPTDTLDLTPEIAYVLLSAVIGGERLVERTVAGRTYFARVTDGVYVELRVGPSLFEQAKAREELRRLDVQYREHSVTAKVTETSEREEHKAIYAHAVSEMKRLDEAAQVYRKALAGEEETLIAAFDLDDMPKLVIG